LTSSSSKNSSSNGVEARRPIVGIGVIILRDHRILLGKRRSSHGAGDWSPPGGHLDFGETPENCAIREVYEETGLSIENVRFVGITNDIFLSEQKHYLTLFMMADCLTGVPELREPDKCEEWVWYDWTNLPEPLFLPLRNLLQQQFDPFSESSFMRKSAIIPNSSFLISGQFCTCSSLPRVKIY